MDKIEIEKIQEKLISLLKSKPKLLKNINLQSMEELLENLEIYQYQLEIQNEQLKKLNTALVKAEEKYFELFHNSPFGYAILDENYKILDINKYFLNILSIAQQSCIGKDIRDFILPNFQDEFYYFWNRILSENLESSLNLMVKSQLNKVYDVLIVGKCVNFLDVTQRNVLLAIFDVGEWKQKISNLDLNEERYRFLENFPDPVIVHINGDIVYSNSATYAHFNLRKNDLLGQNIFKFIHPEDAPKVKENIQKRISGQPFLNSYEIKIKNLEGKIFNVIITITTIEYEGKPGDIIIIKDITFLRQQAQALHDYASYNIVKSAIWSKKDYQNEDNLMNTFLLHLFQEYEISGIAYLIMQNNFFVPVNYYGNFDFDIEKVKILPKTILSIDRIIPTLNKNNEIKDFDLFLNDGNNLESIKEHISLLPFYIDNIFIGIFLFYSFRSDKYQRNIKKINELINEFSFLLSENRKKRNLEEQMNQLKNEALQLNRIKTNFYTRLTNELRTPLLSNVALVNYILKNEKLNPSTREILYSLENSSKYVLKKLSNIADLTCIESGNCEMKLSEFDLNDIVRELNATYKEIANHNSIEFNIEIAQSLNKNLIGDSEKILRILQNLIDNAFQFIDGLKQQKIIIVDIRKAEIPENEENKIWVEFSITDNGKGMSNAKLNEILEMASIKNYKFHSAYEGKGLGIPLTISLVNLLGGFIKVNSKENEGSHISFVIPLKIAK